jgi:ubiquinone/menaquinone biosynthesis C-methylase UbiE
VTITVINFISQYRIVKKTGEGGMKENNEFSFESIHELSRTFQQSRVFLTAFELGIFTVLGDDEKSSGKIAAEISVDPRAVDRLLNALCITGAVIKNNDRFQNSSAAAQFLVKGKPDYQAGMMHAVHLWDSWSRLTESVRNGGMIEKSHLDKRDSEWFEPFIAAMHNRAVKEAPGLVGQIDLSNVEKLLDVGGGSGAYSMAFVKASDRIVATIFDLPNVVELTQKYIKQAGLEERIHTVPGDYNSDELGDGYDMAFLSAIIHSNSPDQNIALFKKVSRALNVGGRIVVSDFIMDDDRTSPAFGAFFSLNMLVNTGSGDTYTESEIKDWMARAGLSFIERKKTRSTGLMIGEKV